MHHSLKKIGLFGTMLFSTIISSTASAATLTVVTKYGDTGGNAGELNNVGDKVNGNNICPAVNDYNNAVAGCDMSSDPGYNDNGTPLIATDDFTEGDLIVRTNDIFNVQVAYGWLGNPGGAEEQVTLTGKLPAGKGFIFEGIPGSCNPAESSLSEDKKTVTCVRKDFDKNDTGSFAEDMAFSVRVEGDAANDSIPGDIVFTVTDPTNSTPATDGVEDGKPGQLLKVTASPRWNIDKHGGAGYYTTSFGVQDDQGNPGWYIWYQFSIEVDEVDGTADDASGRLGNEALKGGKDATVTFVDDISQISPNAKLVTWSANSIFDPPTNPCTMDYHTNSDEPYASFNATYPDRSIKVPANEMTVSCTPDGNGKVNVTVEHIDGTLTGAPTKDRYGRSLPKNRAIAAIGLMRIFVPVSDVALGKDGIANTPDDGSLITTNCLTDFNPIGISGGSNFGNSSESTVDNCRNIALYSSAGSWDKNFRKGWSDQGVEIAKWGGGSWALPPTDASIVESGDGTITPGGVFGTFTIYSNRGGTAIDNPVLCDVIDVETYDMTVIDPNADNAGTFLDDTKHAVDLNYGTTESVPGLTIQYAVGYVGDWPPNPYEAPRTGVDEVVKECSDPNITWYPDYVTAAANGPVSKVRISAPTLPAGKYMAMRIKHTARSTYLSTKNDHLAGEQIPNNQIIVNHATYKSALTGGKYRAGDYYPNDATQNPGNGGGGGDRLIIVRAKARITKAMSPAAVGPGSDVTVTLGSSFTTDGPSPETENVTITDLLPRGITYTNGSTTGTYGSNNTNFGEPTIISPVTDADCTEHAQDLMDNGQACGTFGGTDNNTDGGQSLLIWDLGNQETGTVFEDLVFHAIVDVDAPVGRLANYALIDSPADSSAPSKRISNANTNDSVPSSLLIVKSVQTPLHEVNTDPLLNWMQFRVGLRNGSAKTLTNLDVIDVIPFNGDGVDGSFTFTPQSGTTVRRKRQPATNYNGSFVFDDVSLDKNTKNGEDQCTGTPTFWFTSTSDPIDVSPLNDSNNIAGANTAGWCGGDDTVDAAIATCNFANGKADVRAVRVRGADMIPSGTCFVNLKFATSGNLDNDIYSNTAGAQALGVTSAVLSNTVSAKVFASSIGDKVWFDANADGIQDANEKPIPNIIVKLLDENGSPIKDPANPTLDYQVVTDTDGLYKFENLPAGNYQVKVETGNATITSQGSGNDSALDSDADPATGLVLVSLGENKDATNVDVGITELGSIGNVVWRDLNHDGIQDAGEPGASNVLVTLLDGSGNPILDDEQNPITTTTDGNGQYLFEGLIPGSYSVGFSDLPNGYQMTLQNQDDDATDSDASTVAVDGMFKTSPIQLAIGEDNLTLDAGIFIPASLGNYVWNDKDHDGIQDADEVGVDGVTVTLFNSAGEVVATTTTANGGAYLFEDLPAGTYSVGFSNLPAGAEFTTAGQGTVETGSDVDKATGKIAVTLAEGENNPTLDAGIFIPASLGNHVWNDKDHDGIQDADEVGVDGVTVTLFNSAGEVVATTTTTSGGAYLFEGLVPGDYSVGFSNLPAGAEFTTPGQGTAETDSDVDKATGKTAKVTLEEGDNNPTLDAGIFIPASLGNYVWEDKNHDGIQDADEVGVDGITVTLFNSAGEVVATTTTANGGAYLFEDLPAGAYSVGFSNLPAGAEFTTAGQGTAETGSDVDATTGKTATVTLAEGENNTTLDAGIFKPASLGNFVWNDKDHDGIQDAGEPGVDGVTVTLFDSEGEVVATATTANGGAYLFEGLIPGNYSVGFSNLPTGFELTKANEGDDAKDSDADATGKTDTVTLAPGDNNLTLDAGIFSPASIGDAVWHDKNNNGVYDAGEGLAGVTVELTMPNGSKVTKVTDADGKYLFEGLPAGDYAVEVKDATLPAALQGKNTQDPDATKDGKSSLTLAEGENNLAQDFAYFVPSSIGDTIWNDKDGDGVFDEGEGLAGVTVELTLPDGTKVTKVTDAEGKYLFENLTAGNYAVEVKEETLPAALQGKNTVDPDGGTDSKSTVTLGDGESNLGQDFAYYAPSSIGDTIWHDKNNDGILGAGEGLAGVTVELTMPNGSKVTKVTDADGKYLFEGLPAGDYAVEVKDATLPAALQGKNTQDPDATKDGKSSLTLAEGENNLAQDFAYFAPNSIGDTIWNDKDGDGEFDEGEGLEGVTVELTLPDGTKVTKVTDAEGKYLFENLLAGDYSVEVKEETLPEGLQGKNTVDPDGGTDSKSTLTLGNGESKVDQDFAYFAPASIGETIWHDKNNDGIVDEGEALAGVTVTLTLPNGTTQTTTTDENGKYLFSDLPEGEFTVTVDETTLPEILRGENTQDPDGGNDSTSVVTLDGTGSNFEQNFAYVALGSIGDTVLKDTDHDGIGDEPLAGLIVTLTPPANVDLGNGAGQPITTTTDTDGKYLFPNLPAGDYSVEITPPAGLGNTVDPDGGFNSESAVTLAEGAENLAQNFVYAEVGNIAGTVSVDTDGDGIGDQPLAGVTIKLLDSEGNPVKDGSGNEITTITDGNGNYEFRNVPSGEYQVEQIQPRNYQSVNGQSTIIGSITVEGGETSGEHNYVEEPLPKDIPTLSEWALLMLMMVLGFIGHRQGLTRRDRF